MKLTEYGQSSLWVHRDFRLPLMSRQRNKLQKYESVEKGHMQTSGRIEVGHFRMRHYFLLIYFGPITPSAET